MMVAPTLCCATFQACPQKLATFGACPQKLPTFEDKLGQLVRGADKNTFFWRFLARFSSCFLLFHRQFVYNTDILKKKIGPSWLFLAAGTTDTKFRHSTGVTTANSTNKYQKYKSVELGDQLGTARYCQVQPDTARYSQVQQGTAIVISAVLLPSQMVYFSF